MVRVSDVCQRLCSASIDSMAAITIRQLDEKTKTRLRVRAAHRGRSMEEESREILRSALTSSSPIRGNLAEAVHRRFAAFGGVEFELPRRDPPGPGIWRMTILDTNALSELMRPRPLLELVAWVAKQPATELFTTSITEAEIFYCASAISQARHAQC